jgi:hypothetical protein
MIDSGPPPEEDDAGVADDADMWRRLPPFLNWVIWDARERTFRASSAAFQNLKNRRLSVCLTCYAPVAFTPQAFVERHPGYGVAAIRTGDARAEGQIIVPEAVPDEVAHGHMVGDKPKGVQRALARAARLLLLPEDAIAPLPTLTDQEAR